MYFIYNTILLLFFAVLAPLPALVLLLSEGRRRVFVERCALSYADDLTGFALRPFWIHAVSVGEVMASLQLIGELKRRFPERPVVLSTTTATGNATARAHARAADAIIYFPFDLPPIVTCAVRCIRPEIFIALETEIWPNLFLALHKQAVPIMIASGRISEKSFPGYYRLRFFFRRVLARVSLFLMQSPADAERIKAIGAPHERVSVCGNIKFDLIQPDVSEDEKQELRSLFNLMPDQPLLIAGSTHRGEEQLMLDAFRKLREELPDLLLLIAPRHPERFGEAADTIAAAGLSFIRRTDMHNGARRTAEPVILLDTIGELVRIYSIGTVIVIGGSLVEGIGGHNPLEPAAAGKPVLFGPHMANFRHIADVLTQERAAFQINGIDELVHRALDLLRSPEQRSAAGNAALDVIRRNSGAAAAVADAVHSLLERLQDTSA